MKIFVGFAAFLIPLFASAHVVINEIAWMGTAESSYCEWVELHNDGFDNVDLSGWGLHEFGSSGDVLIMALTKTIAAGGYYLIERVTNSCPDPVSGITADDAGSFGGSGLSNSGETLILKNVSGDEVDRADGSDGWRINGSVDIVGNNTTKDTAQRSGSEWITAAATPRVANAGASSFSENSEEVPAKSSSTGASAPSGSSNAVIDESKRFFTVDAGEDSKTVAGAEVRFSGAAYGFDGKPLDETKGNARYLWNFGDGSFFEAKNVNHIYRYPGTYRATFYVSSGQTSGSDVIEVIVRESSVMISEVAGTWIEVVNEGAAAVDLSSWQISSDIASYTIPVHTIIGPRAFIVFSQETTGLLSGPLNPKAELRYANGAFADTLAFTGTLVAGKSVARDGEGSVVMGEKTPGRENVNYESRIINQEGKEKNNIQQAMPIVKQEKKQAMIHDSPPAGEAGSFMIRSEESQNIELPEKTQTLRASLIDSNYFWLAASISIGLLAGAVVLALRSMIR